MSGKTFSKDDGAHPRVVIAGGGVGALEAVLALRAHADGDVAISMICADSRFDYRPLSVLEPFDVDEGWTVDLAAFAAEHGVELHPERLAGVDAGAHRVSTDSGVELGYDALLIATGCRATEALPGALAFGGHADAAALRGMLDHLDYGQAHRLAFVAPDPSAWLVPLYELTLLARAQLDAHRCKDADITLITAEQDPLEMLGERAIDIAAMLLGRNRITVRAGVRPVSVEERAVVLDTGERIDADHIVTMPRMEGVPIRGVPHDPDGFIVIDENCRVAGLDDVFAAGDVTAGFPKQGGLAARQADAAVGAILRSLGFPVDARPFAAVVEGVLLTGDVLAAFDRADSDGGSAPAWRAPTKIVARHLAPYLETREPSSHFPEEWQGAGHSPAEIEVGGAILDPDSSERLAMRRLPKGDPPRGWDAARAAQSARVELGVLAADDEGSRYLRETLRAFLAAGCSVETAAHDLGCRPREVREAVARSERLLGRDVTERMLDLRIALEVTARETHGHQPRV